MLEYRMDIVPDNPEYVIKNQLYVKGLSFIQATEKRVLDFSVGFTTGYIICFFKKGQGVLLKEGRYKCYDKNQVLVLKAGKPLKISSYNTVCFVLHIDGPNIEGIMNGIIAGKHSELITLLNPDKAKIVFPRIKGSLQKGYKPYKITAYIYNILHELNNSGVEKKDSTNEILIGRAIAYIEENFKKDLHVGDIAQIANFSKFYFTKEFRKVTGLTPIQYVIRKRIRHAEFLLENTEMSIFQISMESGFNTEVNFFNHFKRENNCTPNDYRRIHKTGR